ncbi:hypothetical protein A6A05_17825 [Magnetospirillum moscoviense]|uniref:Uncharacterized protein n=1 Tax=Magnetospirillum moscoviense TaxID=1437059 RepID=A0A178M6K6_9PROT|nr:hypothetical protein A6A05_17825 [Magnetospirillum moscoviense]
MEWGSPPLGDGDHILDVGATLGGDNGGGITGNEGLRGVPQGGGLGEVGGVGLDVVRSLLLGLGQGLGLCLGEGILCLVHRGGGACLVVGKGAAIPLPTATLACQTSLEAVGAGGIMLAETLFRLPVLPHCVADGLPDGLCQGLDDGLRVFGPDGAGLVLSREAKELAYKGHDGFGDPTEHGCLSLPLLCGGEGNHFSSLCGLCGYICLG